MDWLFRFAWFGRPRGLAARAVLLTTGLMALTATLCVGIVLLGADREGQRQQLQIAHDLTTHLATRTVDVIERGQAARLETMIRGAVERRDVRAISIRDARGAILAEAAWPRTRWQMGR